MSVSLSETTLPNGMDIFYLKNINGEWEVPSIYEHVQAYFKNGIQVKEGATVIDIGANIGLFSLMVLHHCRNNATIYSFEPIPPVFEALQKNALKHSPDRINVYSYGISNVAGQAKFTYYPNAPGLSTLYPVHMQRGLDLMIESFSKNNIDKLPSIFNEHTEAEDKLSPEKQARFKKMRALFGVKTLFQSEEVVCLIKPLSTFIEEKAITKIDLLKVDVNGSEYDIFSGIKENHWEIIRQVVTEIPNGENIGKITELLKKQGFNKIIVEEQNAVTEELKYFILYGLKG